VHHLHAEAKFENGEALNRGVTQRRHIEVIAVEYIGKEANRWEEQFYLGELPEAQIEYGGNPADYERIVGVIADAARDFTQIALATEACISRQELAAILNGTATARPRTIRALLRGVAELRTRHSSE
jgi:hypothetical protein